jgi:beta-N-acetylhexosaminidase
VTSATLFQDNIARLSPAELAGQLLVIGFDGAEPPPELELLLGQRARAGVILFRRNLGGQRAGLDALQRLCGSLCQASPSEFPPLIAIDEEGGRVARLRPPALALPPMRVLAELGDLGLIERVGRAVGAQLRCLGVSMNFAPVVDVDTNPDNPIIGDRAFSRQPERVVECAAAYCRGLRAAQVANCLKHFPGHGDTLLDSHLALPRVDHPRDRLERVELLPFARLAALADSMMTAHVMYPALDADAPATLSRRIATDLLRNGLGFTGVLFSDDLEMQAIAGHGSVEQAAIGAIEAGCDLLLICSRGELQERAHAALTRQIERDAVFAARSREAAARGLSLRHRTRPAPGGSADLDLLLTGELARVAAELSERLGRA